jgi:hypothetical protein
LDCELLTSNEKCADGEKREHASNHAYFWLNRSEGRLEENKRKVLGTRVEEWRCQLKLLEEQRATAAEGLYMVDQVSVASVPSKDCPFWATSSTRWKLAKNRQRVREKAGTSPKMEVVLDG